jgi:septum formation protein
MMAASLTINLINKNMNIPKIILASKSPRRQELLRQMDVDFEIVLKEVDESYPENLTPEEVAVYIADKKAKAYDGTLGNEAVLTADTIVTIDGLILGKPEDAADAVRMLKLLSGRVHRVVTGVCILYKQQYNLFHDVSQVFFRTLTDAEIESYVEAYKPFDKAGAYGIQEWVGITAIQRIEGSYTNVVGLPTEKVYQQLLRLSTL